MKLNENFYITSFTYLANHLCIFHRRQSLNFYLGERSRKLQRKQA